jgi:hypothetical protein
MGSLYYRMSSLNLEWVLNLEVTCCESPNNQNRDLQAHAILFVIRYSDSSWESEIAAIKKLLRVETTV